MKPAAKGVESNKYPASTGDDMDSAAKATNLFASFQQALLIFTSIVYEALPFILLGALVAGLLEELLPPRLLMRVLPRSRRCCGAAP